MTHKNTIPEGYRADAKGRLVHDSLVKEIDRKRDKLVTDLFIEAVENHARLAAFKGKVFLSVATFTELSAKQYKVSLGGKKGNLTLYSFDGRIKIVVATADNIRFDERLQAAKALIDECIVEWAEGGRVELQMLVMDAFRVDQEGNLNVGRILGLRRHDIKDARWKRAMKAIGESIQVVGTKSYVRFYQRVGETDQYEHVPLDIAKA